MLAIEKMLRQRVCAVGKPLKIETREIDAVVAVQPPLVLAADPNRAASLWRKVREFTSPTRQRGICHNVFPRLRFGLVWDSKVAQSNYGTRKIRAVITAPSTVTAPNRNGGRSLCRGAGRPAR